MPECVRIDMREAVPGRKLPKPIRYAVWVHRLTVILREHKADVCTVFTQAHTFFHLPSAVSFQKLHRFSRERYPPDRGFRFGRVLILYHFSFL